MNVSDARKAHKILDALFKGNMVLDEEREFLRSALPELPKQMTLEEIIIDVRGAWSCTSGNDWGGNICNMDVSIEDWLEDLHAQLKGLKDAPANAPALPAGMRIAVHAVYGRVVVSPVVDDDGTCKIFHLSTHTRDGSDYCWAPIDSLTFIDYEPAKSAHPEFLETEADYENAPEGTIVARSGQIPWVKESRKQWSCISDDVVNCSMAQSKPRQILRWGWGE